jgi:hypothetical protein
MDAYVAGEVAACSREYSLFLVKISLLHLPKIPCWDAQGISPEAADLAGQIPG